MSDNDTTTAPTQSDSREFPHMHDPDITLRDHVYDGIQEYDQRLPNWWLFTLYIFIALFLVYWVLYYQFGAFHNDKERIDAALTRIETIKAASLKERMSELNNDVFWDMSQNGDFVSKGEATYKTICSTCHGLNLDGKGVGDITLPGLPLNDGEWKYGGSPMNAFEIAMNGSPDKSKGMAPWKDALGTEKVVEVVAYIMSHHQKPGPGEEHPAATADPAAAIPAAAPSPTPE